MKKMSDKIFDLEQQIMDCWHVVDDLKILTESVLEREMTKDNIANITLGLETLYQLKFEKLFDLFETHCKEYHTYRKSYNYPYDNNLGIDCLIKDQND
jgi:hypothetical protein